MRSSIVSRLVALGFVAANSAAVPPTIHVTWGEPGEPQEPEDYEIDATDPDFPNVELITGSLTWQIWSTDTDNPNDLGDIGTISSPHDADFGVKIEDDQGGPGAKRVIGGIHLIPTNSANYSNITGGEIIQNIGGITLQRSQPGDVGGVVDNLVVGDVIGNVTIPVLTSLEMAGLKGGDLTVTDFVSAPGLVLGGQVFNDISIADIHSGGQVLLTNSELTFFGNLDLLNGVPTGAVVRISLDLMGTTIDLNNKDVAGKLECLGDSSASIVNGGNVGGTVVLAGGSGNTYSGTATFVSLSASSEAPAPEIKTVDGADLSGTVDITGVLTGVTGKIIVDGALVGTGLINVEGNFEGDITIGEGTSAQSQITLPTALDNGATIQINTSQGDFNAGGSIEIGVPSPTFVPIPIVFDGCIRIFDELGTGDGGDLTGSIEVCGCHATADDLNICIDGDDNGNVTITQTGCTNQVDYSCGGCP